MHPHVYVQLHPVNTVWKSDQRGWSALLVAGVRALCKDSFMLEWSFCSFVFNCSSLNCFCIDMFMTWLVGKSVSFNYVILFWYIFQHGDLTSIHWFQRVLQALHLKVILKCELRLKSRLNRGYQIRLWFAYLNLIHKSKSV